MVLWKLTTLENVLRFTSHALTHIKAVDDRSNCVALGNGKVCSSIYLCAWNGSWSKLLAWLCTGRWLVQVQSCLLNVNHVGVKWWEFWTLRWWALTVCKCWTVCWKPGGRDGQAFDTRYSPKVINIHIIITIRGSCQHNDLGCCHVALNFPQATVELSTLAR